MHLLDRTCFQMCCMCRSYSLALRRLPIMLPLLILSSLYVFSGKQQMTTAHAQDFAGGTGVISWNPAGDKLAASRKYGFVILDANLQVTTPIITYQGAVRDIAWSPTGARIGTGDATPT